jgi:hypothetical protein
MCGSRNQLQYSYNLQHNFLLSSDKSKQTLQQNRRQDIQHAFSYTSEGSDKVCYYSAEDIIYSFLFTERALKAIPHLKFKLTTMTAG